MKKYLIFLLTLVASFTAVAQDVIVKNDNSTILCKIIEVNNNEVIYLKWSDLNGPRYVMDRSIIANINYQDGRQDKLNQQTSNAYAPGNQQTGEWQYNDQALLAMDKARNNPNNEYKRKARNLKIIGWTVGPVLLLAGIPITLIGQDVFHTAGYKSIYTTGAGILCIGLGIATTTTCIIYSNKYNSIQTYSLINKEINFNNGSFLCAGVDVIRDGQFKQTTLGLGIQYNF